MQEILCEWQHDVVTLVSEPETLKVTDGNATDLCSTAVVRSHLPTQASCINHLM